MCSSVVGLLLHFGSGRDDKHIVISFVSSADLVKYYLLQVVAKADNGLQGRYAISAGDQLHEDKIDDLKDDHRRFARQATTKKVATTTKKAAATTKKATGTTKKATTAKGTTKKANLVAVCLTLTRSSVFTHTTDGLFYSILSLSRPPKLLPRKQQQLRRKLL